MVILDRRHRAAHTVIVKEERQIFFKAPLSRLTGMTVARLFIRERAPAFQAARFPHKIKFLHTGRTDALSLRQDNFAADRTATRKNDGEQRLRKALPEVLTQSQPPAATTPAACLPGRYSARAPWYSRPFHRNKTAPRSEPHTSLRASPPYKSDCASLASSDR